MQSPVTNDWYKLTLWASLLRSNNISSLHSNSLYSKTIASFYCPNDYISSKLRTISVNTVRQYTNSCNIGCQPILPYPPLNDPEVSSYS
jgi:hypothetical protein